MAKKSKKTGELPTNEAERQGLARDAAATGKLVYEAGGFLVFLAVLIPVFALIGGPSGVQFALFIACVVGAGLLYAVGRMLQLQAARFARELQIPPLWMPTDRLLRQADSY